MLRSFLSILLLMLLLSLTACSSNKSTSPDAPEDSAAVDGDRPQDGAPAADKKTNRSRHIREEDAPVPVRIMTMQKKNVVRSVEVSGSVVSNHDVTVLSETAGRVVQDNMTLGKSFRSGEILLSVDPEPYQIQVQIAEGNLETARNAAESAEREYKRLRTLHDSGDVTDSQFDQVSSALDNAAAAVKIAEAGLKQAQRALRLSSVRAPFNGMVAARLAKLGDTLGQGSAVAQLVDADSIKIETGVSEDFISWLSIGHKALVRFPTLNIDSVPASVSAFGLKALQPTMTYPVELRLESVPAEIKVGMVVRVQIDVGESVSALTVPLEILIDRFDKNYVYVIKDSVAEERMVTLGLEVGREVVVLSGIDEGEQVVIYGQANLKNGLKVNVVE